MPDPPPLRPSSQFDPLMNLVLDALVSVLSLCTLHAPLYAPSMPLSMHPPDASNSKAPLPSHPSCVQYSYQQMLDATINRSSYCVLGSGAFGTVYKGKDPNHPDRPVAIKRAKVQTSRFLNEVRGGWVVHGRNAASE